MRWLTAGESHGQALSAIVEGIPASVSVTTADIDYHLQRRRLGVGRGARQNFEADKVTILGGVRLGLTQGGPIAIQVGNSEWPKWEKVMSADPVPEEAREAAEVIERTAKQSYKIKLTAAPLSDQNCRSDFLIFAMIPIFIFIFHFYPLISL